MISTNDLQLWFSKYNLKKTGFHPVVNPVRIVFEHPTGVWRKLIKIVPYSAPDGGFAILMPYHKADSGFLYKACVHDTRAKLLKMPKPNIVTRYVVSSKVKMSFHSDGATQFSSMNGRIISGRDSVTGSFKGLGIMAHSFKNPVRSGPTFGLVAWGLSQFGTCKPTNSDICFSVAEMANPFLRYTKKPALALEGYILPRSKPIASTSIFPDYRAIQNIWNPRFGTLGKREMRLIALHSDEAAIALHVMKYPNVFTSRSGFELGSPRDKNDFGIYAVYPREFGMSGLKSLDYPLDRSATSTMTIIPDRDDPDTSDWPTLLLPEG